MRKALHKGLMTSRSIEDLEFLKKGSLPERKVSSLGRSVLVESVCETSVLTHSIISIPWLSVLALCKS